MNNSIRNIVCCLTAVILLVTTSGCDWMVALTSPNRATVDKRLNKRLNKLREQVEHLQKRASEQETEQPAEQPAEQKDKDSSGRTFKKIPAGTFMMGSPEGEHGRRNDEHQHKVTISKAFYMQTTEVTQGQWWDIMRTQPWRGERLSDHVKEGVNYPATYVSWKDAVAYCKLLSEYSTKVHRLPTEAEWEYACRAGTTTAYSFGDDAIRLSEYAWHELNSNAIEGPKYYNHQVGLKKSNAFGLYDMYGNVHEWCSDYYGEDYYKQSPATDPTGPASGVKCVFRGGSLWHGAMDSRGAVHYSPVACRSASRVSRNVRQRAEASGHERHLNFGFRIVRELD